jgi:hypothetical protein
MVALDGNRLEDPLTCLGDLADDFAAMGWDLETVSETDLKVLEQVVGPVSQTETPAQIETQAETERMLVGLN